MGRNETGKLRLMLKGIEREVRTSREEEEYLGEDDLQWLTECGSSKKKRHEQLDMILWMSWGSKAAYRILKETSWFFFL